MQEGFSEAVEKNEISLRTTDKLAKGNYNEFLIGKGVLYIRDAPLDLVVNVADVRRDLIDLL